MAAIEKLRPTFLDKVLDILVTYVPPMCLFTWYLRNIIKIDDFQNKKPL